MEYENNLNVKMYLNRFEQILCSMSNRMLSSNITVEFIKCMIPHHQAAIAMSENLLKYTKYEPLKVIAKNIITMQSKGIKQMEEIFRTTNGFCSFQSDMNCYMKNYILITENMVSKMKSSPHCMDINLNFVNEMIPHHIGAIYMCENLLSFCIDPRLRDVANSIIEEQSKGVKELEKIRNIICSHN